MPDREIILGRYHALERLGSDPLGEVSRARLHGVGGFEKDFAVTRLHRHLCQDPQLIARLVRAAALAARLQADRLQRVQTIDAERGQYFLVCDLARGLDLAVLGELLRARGERFPRTAALALALDVIEAVDAAHARIDIQPGGVLHLLLSPHAVMVDADGESRVLCTGLYPSLMRPGWADSGLLKIRQPWLAPEVIAGHAADARADVYSVGALVDDWTDGAPDDVELSRMLGRARALAVEARLPSLQPLKRLIETRLPERGRARRELALLVGRWLASPAAPGDVTRQQLTVPEEAPRLITIEAEPEDPMLLVTEEQTRSLGPGSPPLELDDTLLGQPLPPLDPRAPPPFQLGAPFAERTDMNGMPRFDDTAHDDAWHVSAQPLLSPIVPSPPSSLPPRSITQALPPLALHPPPMSSSLVAKLVVAAGAVMILAGAALLWAPRREGKTRAAAARGRAAPQPPSYAFGVGGGAPALPSLTVTTAPPGARVFVDGVDRGASPLALALEAGRHHLSALADGHQLVRRDFELPAEGLSLMMMLPESQPAGGPFGLKVYCETAGELRVFVDDVDTGVTCSGDTRIAVSAGPHRLTLYAPRSDELITVHKQVEVIPRSTSTRVYLKY